MELIEQPVLNAGTFLLRPFQDSDLDLIHGASKDLYITQITTVPFQGSRQQCLDFIERQRQRTADGTGYSFAIAQSATNIAVGQIGLWLRNAERGRASIGYWVSPQHQRRGVASTALKTISDWGLSYPGIHRVELYVEPWNEGSWRAAERCGFQREGLLRSWEIIGGEAKDLYMYSRIAPTLKD